MCSQYTHGFKIKLSQGPELKLKMTLLEIIDERGDSGSYVTALGYKIELSLSS
jgi:hypothetical protein